MEKTALGALNALPTLAAMKQTMPRVGQVIKTSDSNSAHLSALRHVYDSNHRSIFALCYRMLGNEQDAQDAVQSTFIRAYKGLDSFRGESQLKTWLYRIAVNESVAILRKRRPGQTELDDIHGSIDQTVRIATKLSVEQALQRVSLDHRTVLILRFWEELSYEEISDTLGISLSAAKMRLQRARIEFKKWFEED